MVLLIAAKVWIIDLCVRLFREFMVVLMSLWCEPMKPGPVIAIFGNDSWMAECANG